MKETHNCASVRTGRKGIDMKMTVVVIFLFLFALVISIFGAEAGERVLGYGNQFDLAGLSVIEQGAKKQGKKKWREQIYQIKLEYSRPENVLAGVRALFPGIVIAVDLRTRSLVVKTDLRTYKKVLKACQQMDQKLRQVKVEVKILELSYVDFDEYKNIFTALTDGFKVNYDFAKGKLQSDSEFEGTLAYLVREGKAKVLAKPTVMVLDNQLSIIKVGDRIPYVSTTIENGSRSSQVSYLDAGIELQILPRIASGNIICAEIEAEISNVKLWKEYKDNAFPIISSRSTKTKVNIKNKDTLVIAGLIDEQDIENVSGVPLLRDLPVIGKVFQDVRREKVRSDVVFVIGVEILE